jgi:hypothetical protein
MERIERLQQEKYALGLLYEAGPVSKATNVGLRCALKLKYWDVIERKVLDRKEVFWEQVRRETFTAAVQQREWAFVERWADHSLFHEERWWAMEEAYKEKQWSAMLTLADHGLTDVQMTKMTWCRLAMYADWDVVLQMFERGADITEMRESVERVKDTAAREGQETDREALTQRWEKLCRLEETMIEAGQRASAVNYWSWSSFCGERAAGDRASGGKERLARAAAPLHSGPGGG